MRSYVRFGLHDPRRVGPPLPAMDENSADQVPGERFRITTIELAIEFFQWSPLRQEPEAPTNNATSRDCLLTTTHSAGREEALSSPRSREPGDPKARDGVKDCSCTPSACLDYQNKEV